MQTQNSLSMEANVNNEVLLISPCYFQSLPLISKQTSHGVSPQV